MRLSGTLADTAKAKAGSAQASESLAIENGNHHLSIAPRKSA